MLYHEAKEYKYPLNSNAGALTPIEMECFNESNISQSELIIFLLGFEGLVTKKIDIEKEPAKKIILNGFPSYLLSYKDISILENQHLFSNDYELDYCNASNPFIVYNKLKTIYEKNHTDYEITIAVCGSTPSTVGAVMFAKDYNDINIVSVRAEKYNFIERLSNNYWIYDMS